MRMHVFQTGTVAIKQRQVHGVGAGMQRRLNTLLICLSARYSRALVPSYIMAALAQPRRRLLRASRK